MNKKDACQVCKRVMRTKNFVLNPLKNIIVCRRCDKKIGHNKFYTPKIKRNDFIGNFNLTTQERQRLFTKYISQGKSSEQANFLVNRHLSILKNMKYRKRIYPKKEQINNKQFLEGMKC